MRVAKGLSVDDLRELLIYDSGTGTLRWKYRDQRFFSWHQPFHAWNTKYAGKIAGKLTNKGYVAVRIFGTLHSAHRIAWALHHGVWPSMALDHRNGDKSDNRIANLREADPAQNSWNTARSIRQKQKHARGVIVQKGARRFGARIVVRGKYLNLGIFDSEEAAHAAYCAAAKQHFGEFARYD